MRIAASLAMLAMVAGTASSAQAATASICVTEAEANTVVMTLLPDVLDTIGRTCDAVLPAGATLRARAPLVARYRQASGDVWAQARSLVTRIAGPELEGIDGDLIRPLIGTLLAPVVTRGIRPADCPAIDRVVAAIAPLPARNAASLIVALFQLSEETRSRLPFTICQDRP